MELRERGWGVDAAARAVCASRTAGRNWAYGYRTYRAGHVVGFVPALERLAVREVSARFLSQDERIEIADLRQAGVSVRQIASRRHRRNDGEGGGGNDERRCLRALGVTTTGAAMRPRQMALAFDGDDQRPIPLVYLACRLTNLSDDQRKLLDSWCTNVEQAVTDATRNSDTPWNVAVHVPCAWSAPWNDGRHPRMSTS
jgi:hypothetical protein